MAWDLPADIRNHRWARLLALFSPTILIIVVSLVLQEFYPISHNPMYSGLGGKTTAFHVTDQEDNVIPFAHVFGDSLVKFMKIMRTTRKRIEKEHGKQDKRPRVEYQKEAAPEVLTFFLENRRPMVADQKIEATSLKVWVIRTERVGRKLEKETTLLCELPVPANLRASGEGVSQ